MRRAPITAALVLLAAVLLPLAASRPAGAATPCDGRDATIVGTNAGEVLVGTAGNDVIAGQGGDDVIRGLEGNDVLCGGPGSDQLIGAAGDDRLVETGFDFEARNVLSGGAGNDSYLGGDSYDTADFNDPTSGATSVTVDLGAYYALGQGLDEIVRVEAVRGTTGNDTITGNDGDNDLFGLAGNDTLRGGGETDVLAGGPGNDALDGQLGYDRASYAGVAAPIIGNLTTRVATGEGTDTLDRVEGFIGGRGNDRLTGWIFDDTIEGGPGNDVIDGQDGNDWVVFDSASAPVTADLQSGTATGQGTDSLLRVENLRGGAGKDLLRGNDAANRFIAGQYDVVEGRGGKDDLRAPLGILEPATATASYASAPGKIAVDLGAGTSTGAAGEDTIDIGFANLIGSNFSDRLTCDSDGEACSVDGLKGDDTITGTPFEDHLSGGLGNDRIDGRDGDDTVHYEGTAPVKVDIPAGRATGQGTDTLVAVESAIGSSAADTLVGGGDEDCYLIGGGGNDTLRSAGNHCTMHGREGNDTLIGTDGPEQLTGGPGNDVVDGRGGDDLIYPDTGDDRIDGGAGTDLLPFFSLSPGPLNANLVTGVVVATGLGTDAVSNVEDIEGTSGNDVIRGTNGPNAIDAGSGADTVYGMGGNDELAGGTGFNTLIGGPGNDVLIPGQDVDTVTGGADVDTVEYGYSSGPVEVSLATGSATGQGPDQLTSIENVNGSQANDVLRGDAGPNRIDGAGGTDTCDGGGGTDVLVSCP